MEWGVAKAKAVAEERIKEQERVDSILLKLLVMDSMRGGEGSRHKTEKIKNNQCK